MKKHRVLITLLSVFLGIILLFIAVFGVSALSHHAKENSTFTLDEDYLNTAYHNAELSSGLWKNGTYAITDKGGYRDFWNGPELYPQMPLL